MTTYITEHEVRLAEYGWEPVEESGQHCPRELVGMKHLGELCWCTSRLNDHGGRYRHLVKGGQVVIWEPYDTDADELEVVLAHARQDGLHVYLTGASPWNPGHTVAIIFEKRI